MDLAALRRETEKVLKDDDPGALDDLINRRIAGDSEWVADVVRGGLGTVPGCRYPRMEIRRDSQLSLLRVFPTKKACLHMSKLSDYHGNTLLIGQAPKQIQFAYHWRAIWQERVSLFIYKNLAFPADFFKVGAKVRRSRVPEVVGVSGKITLTGKFLNLATGDSGRQVI